MSDEIKSRSSAALATLRILNCRIRARSCCCSSKTAFSLLGFSSHAVPVISKEINSITKLYLNPYIILF